MAKRQQTQYNHKYYESHVKRQRTELLQWRETLEFGSLGPEEFKKCLIGKVRRDFVIEQTLAKRVEDRIQELRTEM